MIDRAVRVLDCFSFDASELTLQEVSQKTGLHKSTVHRILSALGYHQLVVQDEKTGQYHLGLRLFALGVRAVARLRLREVAEPHLIRLMQETKETVHLAVLDGDEVLYLAKVEGPHALRMPSRVGRQIPAYCTSLGKAMLSCLDEAAVRALLPREPFKVYTPKTIRTVRELLADLERARSRGYAVDDEEIEVGLRCVGAPLRDYSGSMVGAISVAAPSARLAGETIEPFGLLVAEVAAAISRELGYGQIEGSGDGGISPALEV